MKTIKVAFFCEKKPDKDNGWTYPVFKVKVKMMDDNKGLTNEMLLSIAAEIIGSEEIQLNNIETEFSRPQIVNMDRWNQARVFIIK